MRLFQPLGRDDPIVSAAAEKNGGDLDCPDLALDERLLRAQLFRDLVRHGQFADLFHLIAGIAEISAELFENGAGLIGVVSQIEAFLPSRALSVGARVDPLQQAPVGRNVAGRVRRFDLLHCFEIGGDEIRIQELVMEERFRVRNRVGNIGQVVAVTENVTTGSVNSCMGYVAWSCPGNPTGVNFTIQRTAPYYEYGTPVSGSGYNQFQDAHVVRSTSDLLGVNGAPASCQQSCAQTYTNSCGAQIGSFTITYTFTHATGVTNVSVAKQ